MTSSGWAASTGPSPRSPVASSMKVKAGRRTRTGLRPRSSLYTGTTNGRVGSAGVPTTARIVSTANNGWSPRTTSTAFTALPASATSAGPLIDSKPTARELARPRSGSGLTTRRSARQAIEASIAGASCPSTTTTSVSPAAARRSRTCCRIGRPASDASSFPPPNREPAPAASTSARVPSVMRPSSHLAID